MPDPLRRDRARELRRKQTEEEKHVWYKLRGRRFEGFKFRRQQSIGPFFVDFVCLDRRLIIELDGSQHVNRAAYDAQRTQWLEREGFQIIRMWNHQVWQDWDTMEQHIWEQLNLRPSRLALLSKCDDEGDNFKPLPPNGEALSEGD